LRAGLVDLLCEFCKFWLSLAAADATEKIMGAIIFGWDLECIKAIWL
jgi:hypothetical protein